MTLSPNQSLQWLCLPPPPCEGCQSSAAGMHSESAAPQLPDHGNAPAPTASLFAALQLRWGTPALTKNKSALQQTRSSNAANMPVKIALSGPGWMQRAGPGRRQPAGDSLQVSLSSHQRDETPFLLHAGPAGLSRRWWDGHAIFLRS